MDSEITGWRKWVNLGLEVGDAVLLLFEPDKVTNKLDSLPAPIFVKFNLYQTRIIREVGNLRMIVHEVLVREDPVFEFDRFRILNIQISF